METVQLAVNGTLMRGFALNRNLLAVGATFVHEAVTAPIYRLWSIDDQYPAMRRVTAGGAAIALEVWAVPMHTSGDDSTAGAAGPVPWQNSSR